jgi:hypothetical protein
MVSVPIWVPAAVGVNVTRTEHDPPPAVTVSAAPQSATLCILALDFLHIVGLNGSPCEHIGIGDKAAFLHDREVVFWIDEKPFNVQSASLKK